MLETLKIKNIAVIDAAEIPFRKGLNILSGETGAGKSIVIEAISLLLGGRASSELIRSGCDEATVEGLFDTREISWIQTRLKTLGFETNSHELLIKRSVHKSGKHRIYVNGELATLSILQTLCEGLIDLCGQHEHQSLLKASTQIDLLDRYGGLTEKTKFFSATFSGLKALEKEQTHLLGAESERIRRADFLSFQIDELKKANLAAGEDEKLIIEKQLLQSAESRAQSADSVSRLIEDDEGGILQMLRVSLNKLRPLLQLDSKIQPVQEGLERALAETEEVSIALARYLGTIDLNSERLETVQERLSLIADLRRKYGSSVGEMLDQLEHLEAEYSTLGRNSERLEKLSTEIRDLQTELRAQAKELSLSRNTVARTLSDSVTGELKDLKMGDAEFAIELIQKNSFSEWNQSGADSIQFLAQTNRGDMARPIGKVASGGELSRLMLAIRRVIADKGGIGVYLFDEIDAGIGGQTAFQVGKKLKSVASYNQVICITHLPQVASFADHHLVVKKSSLGKRTVTEVVELTAQERKEELARMLGGAELTQKSLDNAAELMELAR